MTTHQVPQKTVFLTLAERQAYEQKWRRVFSAYGLILAITLTYLVASYYSPWSYAPVCYVIGSLAVIGCLHAGKKLRDLDRVNAAIDAQLLLGAHNNESYDDIDD